MHADCLLHAQPPKSRICHHECQLRRPHCWASDACGIGYVVRQNSNSIGLYSCGHEVGTALNLSVVSTVISSDIATVTYSGPDQSADFYPDTTVMVPANLDDNIEKLIDRGLIREIARSSANDDPRRRYYQLTTFGRRVLSAEVVCLGSFLRAAKMRLQSPILSPASTPRRARD